MGTVNGVVEFAEKNNKWGKTSIKVNGIYYTTKPEWFKGDLPNKGDTVEFDDGGGKFIKGTVRIVGSGGGASAPQASTGGGYTETKDRQNSIVRQNALTNATNLYTNYPSSLDLTDPEQRKVAVNTIIAIADQMYAYTSGALEELLLAKLSEEDSDA